MAEIDWSKGNITSPQNTADATDWSTGNITKPGDQKTALGDLGRKFKSGVEQLPGMVTGLADIAPAIATGTRPFTAAADYLGSVTGFTPGKWAKEIQYSDANAQGAKNVDEAWTGIESAQKDPAKTKSDVVRQVLADAPKIADSYIRNPMYTAGQVVESVPSMLAGGVASKGLMVAGRAAGVVGAAADAATGAAATAGRAAVPGYLERTVGEKMADSVAAGVGEGIVTAGQQMDQYEGGDQRRNALASLAAGAGTGAIGAAAGRAAHAMGLETSGTAMARIGDAATTPAEMSAKRRILGGMISESVLQELPQSAQEQVWQNYADGKPLMEGVLRQGVEGALAGAVMGAGANLRGRSAAPAPTAQPAQTNPDWTTEPGATGPQSAARDAVQPPEAPDLQTTLGAQAPREGGIDYQREIPTDGLSLVDPAEEARARAATIDMTPADTTPQWSTQAGAAGMVREGLDPTPQEFDTSGLSLQGDPAIDAVRANRLAAVGVADAQPNSPLTNAALAAVDSGAHGAAMAERAATQAPLEAHQPPPVRQQDQAQQAPLAHAAEAVPLADTGTAPAAQSQTSSIVPPSSAPLNSPIAAAPTPQERIAALSAEIASSKDATGKPLNKLQVNMRRTNMRQLISDLPADQIEAARAQHDAPPQELTRATDIATGPARVLQNRDRSSVASIAQMNEIAAKPDYWRAGQSRVMENGAPVVFGSAPANALVGKADQIADGLGKRVPVQYAVVESADVLPSHQADGAPIAEYQNGMPGKLRAVAGNGRAAGIGEAYRRNTAVQYRQDLTDDAADLGIDPVAVRAMKAPVLVRVMPEDQVTDDIGDRSNIGGTAALSATEQAANDARRIDLSGLTFDDNGIPDRQSAAKFVNTMPVSERGTMMQPDGSPTRQLIDRITSAAFKAAYGNDDVVRLQAQSTDPEVRNIITAMASAAGQMAGLEGAGDFDIRGAVAEAAQMAVNAKRQGITLTDYLNNADITFSGEAFTVARFMADNIRSAKRMAEGLRAWANYAAEQVAIVRENEYQNAMFGATPTASRGDTFNQLGVTNDQSSATQIQDGGNRVSRVADRAPRQAAQPAPEQNRTADSQEKPAQQDGAEKITQPEPAHVPELQDVSQEKSPAPGAQDQQSAAPAAGEGRGPAQGVASTPALEQSAVAPDAPIKASENPPFNPSSNAPASPGVYKMRDGSFARFDRGIWWRAMPSAKNALLTEFAGSDQMKPENRHGEYFDWLPHAEISKRDAFGEPSAMRLVKAKIIPALEENPGTPAAEPPPDRPSTWRKNYIQARAVAKSLGITPVKGVQLPGLLAEIDRTDSAARADPAAESAQDVANQAPAQTAPAPKSVSAKAQAANERKIKATELREFNKNWRKNNIGKFDTWEEMDKFRTARQESRDSAAAALKKGAEELKADFAKFKEWRETARAKAAALDTLTAPTPQDILDQQARTEAAAQTEKSQQRAADERARRERERKDIAKASESAADTFVLDGDTEQNLSGQQSVFDAPAEQAAPAAEKKSAPTKAPITSLTFDQWVKQSYESNEYKDSYLEAFDGNEKLAMLGSVIGTTDQEKKPGAMLNKVRQRYFDELISQPWEASLSFEVFDGLTPAQKSDAQRHFFDMDGRLIRRTQDEISAKNKTQAAARKPYEDARDGVIAEIKRLDSENELPTAKAKTLNARLARLEDAIYQIGQGIEPDGRLLKAAPAREANFPEPATADGTPAFSRTQTPASPQAVEKIQTVVSRITARWRNAPEIIVATSMDDPRIPQAARDEDQRQRATGATGSPEGFVHAGKVYLLADQLASPERAATVLMHEALGHIGLQGVFGDSLKGILQQVATMRQADIKAKAEQYGLDMSNAADRLTASEEVLAEMAQAQPEIGFVKRAVAAIRTWLRDNVPGFKALALTDADISHAYLIPARGWVERGRVAVSGGNTPMFSRSPAAAINARLNAKPETTMGDTGRYDAAQKAAMRNIGATITEKSIAERTREFWKGAGKRMAQGLADQFAPIKEISKEAYGLARLAKGASGAFEALLQGGKLKLTDGVYDFDEAQRGGVVETLLKPMNGEHHDALRWVAANRAEQLMNESEATRAEGAALLAQASALNQQARALESAGKIPEAKKLRAEVEIKKSEGDKKKNVSRENLFTRDDIAALKRLSDGDTSFDYTIQNGVRKGAVTRKRSEIYKDFNATLNGFNRNVLDLTEKSGLIDPESRKVWERDFYVPFYRVSEDDGGSAGGANVSGSMVRQKAFERLKGGKQKLSNDLLDNVLMNWAHLLDASAKNRAAKATLEAAAAMPTPVAIEAPESTVRSIASEIGKKNSVVWFMDGGKQRYFIVDDPYVLTAITALEYAGMRNPVMNAMGAFKHALTVGVTASPFFKIRNLIRDSLQVVASAPLDYNVAKNIKQGFALTNPRSDAYFRLLAGGGTIHFGTMMEGSEGKRVQSLVESGVKESTILNGDHKIKAFYQKYIEPGVTAYNELGNRGEAINRAALYDQLIKQGVSHAEASLQARDLMDFSMQGSFTAVRFLTQVVPFMNARIQGLYKLGRAAKEDPRRMAVVLGTTAAFSVALMAAYSDDDDWKKREEFDRNNFWWFKFGGEAFRIPKPFEIGAMATLAERGFELAFSKEMTSKRFMEQVRTLLSDNLSMSPIPQMFKPVIDVYANKDSFSGRPIEGMGMDKLRPEYRFSDRTSMLARGASSALNAATGVFDKDSLSPVQIDHMLRGYFGWLGSFVVGTSEIIARPATGQATQAAPDYWKMATGGIVSTLDGAQSRYVSSMYEQASRIEQDYGTWRAMIKEGKPLEAQEYRTENAASIGKYHRIEAAKKQTATLNQQIKIIERGNASSTEKRERITALRNQQNLIAKMAMSTE